MKKLESRLSVLLNLKKLRTPKTFKESFYMGANTKYFDITIDHVTRSFSIQHTGFKPAAKDSALITLAKIESVAKEGFTYTTSRQDEYSELSKERMLETLKTKSSEIHAGYN